MADILGTPNNDVLFGTPEDDKTVGFAGADWLLGLTGNDILSGGRGGDLLFGDVGRDLVVGVDGDDFLFGGPDGDVLNGGRGADLLVGGPGHDILILGSGGERTFGNEGNDAFLVFPGGRLATSPETEVIIETGPAQHRFTVELPETPVQQARGLMFRPDLAADRGMLFDFGTEQPVAFWMQNTFVSLDILFIDADGHIVRVAEHTVPLSEEPIPSGEPVRAVLEVPAGTAAALSIDVGDRVLHPLFGTGDATLAAPEDGAGAVAAAGRGDGEPDRDGNDIIEDFARGEDVIRLLPFTGLRFADLDTNGDGTLDDGDAPVSVIDGTTVIDLAPFSPAPAVPPYTLTVAGVTGLTAADFVLPPAELNEETPATAGAMRVQPAEQGGGAPTEEELAGGNGALGLTEVLTGTESGLSDLAEIVAHQEYHPDPAAGLVTGAPEGTVTPPAFARVAGLECASVVGFDDWLNGTSGASFS